MKGSFTTNTIAAITDNYQERRDICLVPYLVTFASINKVKFYREFNLGVHSERVAHLEKEAQSTVFKLKTSFLFRNGIIESVNFDINRSEGIIYFDIILAQGTPQTSFIELLGYLNNCL